MCIRDRDSSTPRRGPSASASTSTVITTASTIDDDDTKSASSPTPRRTHSTAHLPYRLLSDLLAAGTAGLAVSPLISMIDRAIMEAASGRSPSLRASLARSARGLLARPHRFLLALPHRLVLALYAGTYAAANLLDTAASVSYTHLTLPTIYSV